MKGMLCTYMHGFHKRAFGMNGEADLVHSSAPGNVCIQCRIIYVV